jgi:toxin FitB
MPVREISLRRGAPRYEFLSELRRPRREPKVLAFVAAQPLDLLYLSSVTLAEIRYGIERIREETPAGAPSSMIGSRTRFDRCSRIVTEDLMFKRRLLVEEGRKAGHTFSQLI